MQVRKTNHIQGNRTKSKKDISLLLPMNVGHLHCTLSTVLCILPTPGGHKHVQMDNHLRKELKYLIGY